MRLVLLPRRHLARAAVLFTAALLAACIDTGAPQRGRVAVLDLERVANEAGFKSQVQDALKQFEGTLNKSLEDARKAAADELASRREQLGVSPTAAQQAQLRAFVDRTRQQLLKLKEQANSQLGARRAQLIEELKAHVRPVAQSVAGKRGMDVVMLRTNNLLSFGDTSDITSEVLATLRGEVRPLTLTPAQSAEKSN